MENIERDVSYLRAVARVGVGQTVGDLIEKSLGINQQVIAKESKNLTNGIVEQMHKGGEWFDSLREKGYDVKSKSKGTINTEAKTAELPKEEKKVETTESSKSSTPTKTILEVKLSSSDVSTDELKRRLWADPTWMYRVKNDFINNVPTGK
jgi:hypothetical protein